MGKILSSAGGINHFRDNIHQCMWDKKFVISIISKRVVNKNSTIPHQGNSCLYIFYTINWNLSILSNLLYCRNCKYCSNLVYSYFRILYIPLMIRILHNCLSCTDHRSSPLLLLSWERNNYWVHHILRNRVE